MFFLAHLLFHLVTAGLTIPYPHCISHSWFAISFAFFELRRRKLQGSCHRTVLPIAMISHKDRYSNAQILMKKTFLWTVFFFSVLQNKSFLHNIPPVSKDVVREMREKFDKQASIRQNENSECGIYLKGNQECLVISIFSCVCLNIWTKSSIPTFGPSRLSQAVDSYDESHFVYLSE